jgi:hypothetical protein
MPTIVWSPRGCYLIAVLAKGRKFNATYYVTEVLSVISKWRSTEAKGDERKLIVNADNALPHSPAIEFDSLSRMG